ncbi:MAG TPA: hypothetical protein VM639_23590 [Dongiaceae bacterium]|nr:hypothetical protein [Dongiaceae bacterium]
MAPQLPTHAYEIEEVGGKALFRVLRRLPGDPNTSVAGSDDVVQIAGEKWAVIHPHLLAYLGERPSDARRSSKTRPFIRLNVSQGQACETFLLITASVTDTTELAVAAENWFSKAAAPGKRIEIGSLSLAAAQLCLVGRLIQKSGTNNSAGIARLPSTSVDLFIKLLQRFGSLTAFDVAGTGPKMKVRWAWVRTGLGTTIGLMPTGATRNTSEVAGATFFIASVPVGVRHQAALYVSRQIDAVRQTVREIDTRIDEASRPEFLELVRELDRELSLVQLGRVHLLPSRRGR